MIRTRRRQSLKTWGSKLHALKTSFITGMYSLEMQGLNLRLQDRNNAVFKTRHVFSRKTVRMETRKTLSSKRLKDSSPAQMRLKVAEPKISILIWAEPRPPSSIWITSSWRCRGSLKLFVWAMSLSYRPASVISRRCRRWVTMLISLLFKTMICRRSWMSS